MPPPKQDHEKRESTRSQIYKTAFGTDDGKKVLWDLMAVFKVGDQIHVPGDPYETAFCDGQRSVVLHIMSLLRYDPDRFQKEIQNASDDFRSV